jgi:uncharacterized protein (DUF2147 family)
MTKQAVVVARLLLFVVLLASSNAEAEAAEVDSSIVGLWATEKNHGLTFVELCGDAVCGKVVDGDQLRANPDQTDIYNPDPAKRSRRVKGLYILQGYRGGPPQWQRGTVYDPQTGDSSSDSTLELMDPNTLRVKGCKLFFCRSEVWTRVPDSKNVGSSSATRSPHG